MARYHELSRVTFLSYSKKISRSKDWQPFADGNNEDAIIHEDARLMVAAASRAGNRHFHEGEENDHKFADN